MNIERPHPVPSSARRKARRVAWLLVTALGSACSPSSAPAPSAPAQPALGEPALGEPAPAASEGGEDEAARGNAAPSRVDTAPARGEATAATEASAERDVASPMTAFFEVGRGERVADLGGVSGYSLQPLRRALGRAGVLYVRRRPPPPVEAEQEMEDAAPIVWMDTPDEAPLIPEAKRLNLVTFLFGYHAVIAAGYDRKKLNGAVFRALEPGGSYIVAEHAAPPGTGLGSALAQARVEPAIVRAEVEAAGFVFVEAADFIPSSARSAESSPTTQYVLKFRKPR